MSLNVLFAEAEVAQAADMAQAGGPNWVLIIGIAVVFVVLACLLLIPSKKAIGEDDKKAIEDKSKDKPALTDDDKDKKSLAEIKESKRANGSDSKSKDEMRELRKERRAATQTEKAIQEREDAKDAADAEKSVEESAEPDVDAAKALEKAEKAEAEAKAEAEDEHEKMTAPIDDIITKSDADVGDVLSSLFGGSEKSALDDLNFDDVIGKEIEAPQGPVFPTLGSALIPLSELTAAADKAEKEELSPLDEISKKLAEKAEKKTL